MDDLELNRKLSNLSDDESLSPIPACGKAIAYYGWFWRTVDFSIPLRFAYADGNGIDVPSWVGFCENNKWDYEIFEISWADTQAVRELCVSLAETPSRETATKLFEFMQSLKPAHVTGRQRWNDV